MALRGFIIVLVLWVWFGIWTGAGAGTEMTGGWRVNRVRVQNHKKIILDGHIVAPAIGRAGDGKISRGFRVRRHNAAGVADGLRISALADAERKTIGRIAKFPLSVLLVTPTRKMSVSSGLNRNTSSISRRSWCNPKCAALFQNSDNPPRRRFRNGMPSKADRLWPCPEARAGASASPGRPVHRLRNCPAEFQM
jgi:hypothetical protein